MKNNLNLMMHAVCQASWNLSGHQKRAKMPNSNWYFIQKRELLKVLEKSFSYALYMSSLISPGFSDKLKFSFSEWRGHVLLRSVNGFFHAKFKTKLIMYLPRSANPKHYEKYSTENLLAIWLLSTRLIDSRKDTHLAWSLFPVLYKASNRFVTS